jgi:hypothetical protein
MNGKGYVGTGAGYNGATADFWEYDPVTDTWTQKADFGGGIRRDAIGFSINGKGYLGTGTGVLEGRVGGDSAQKYHARKSHAEWCRLHPRCCQGARAAEPEDERGPD